MNGTDPEELSLRPRQLAPPPIDGSKRSVLFTVAAILAAAVAMIAGPPLLLISVVMAVSAADCLRATDGRDLAILHEAKLVPPDAEPFGAPRLANEACEELFVLELQPNAFFQQSYLSKASREAVFGFYSAQLDPRWTPSQAPSPANSRA